MHPPSADDREGGTTLFELGSLQWTFVQTQQGGGCSDYFDRVVMPPPPSIVASTLSGAPNSHHFDTPPLPCEKCPVCYSTTFTKQFNRRQEDHRYDGYITAAWYALMCGACGRWLATYELGGGTEWEKRRLQLWDGTHREW